MKVWYDRTDECQKNTSLSGVNELNKPIVNYPSVSSVFNQERIKGTELAAPVHTLFHR